MLQRFLPSKRRITDGIAYRTCYARRSYHDRHASRGACAVPERTGLQLCAKSVYGSRRATFLRGGQWYPKHGTTSYGELGARFWGLAAAFRLRATTH